MHREWVKDLRKGGATSQGIVVALYNSEVGSPSRRLSDQVKVDEKQVEPNTGAEKDSGRSLNDDRTGTKVI